MRGLRHDPPKDGVTVNCIAPGGTGEPSIFLTGVK